MVQLRSCYFCGTTEALSEYETLPERVDGGEASRQVVLCDRCHAKLTNVLAPIVDRLEGGSDRPVPSGSTSAGGASADSPETPAPTDRQTQTDVTFGDASAPDDPDPSSPPVDPASPASDARDTGDATEESDADDSDDPSDGGDGDDAVDEGGDTDDAGGGEAADRVAATESDAPAAAHDAVDGGSDSVVADSDATDDDPDATATDSGGDEAPTDSGDAATARADLDRVYHKLLRFLRNREFPIPRTEAERIAQSAYDLTAPEASEVIQRAVDRGVLEDHDGELHRA
jgi:hypothetical protein